MTRFKAYPWYHQEHNDIFEFCLHMADTYRANIVLYQYENKRKFRIPSLFFNDDTIYILYKRKEKKIYRLVPLIHIVRPCVH